MTDVETKHTNKNAFHLAGIIPVAGQPLGFNMPWDDCLMPVAPGYAAVERAVYEAACAGCETIWIVLHKEAQPIIRHRLGDWIEDPTWSFHARKKFDKFPSAKRKEIPIYYVPIHPKDRDKRDCEAWSILYGCLRAFHISKKISQWVVPDKYYVAFPHGVYSCNKIRKDFRPLISDQNRFFVSWNGKTIADGERLGFTFNAEDFVRYRRIIREGTGLRAPGGSFEEGFTNLPQDKRWSARYFTLDKVFKSAILDGANIGPVEWYYDISNWDNYCEYLGSEERKWVTRPNKILKYHEFNPIGEDDEESI